MTRARHDESTRANDIERRLDALAARRWSKAEEMNRLTLGSGDDEVTLYGPPAATAAFVATLTAAGDALHEARVEAATLRTRVEQLARARDTAEAERARTARSASHAAAAPASHAAASSARSDAGTGPRGRDRGVAGSHATLESVPASLIAPFRPDARTLTAAKENPLVALAVQATKAMQPDASELERARLLAMAYAASTGDLERFWTARAQRSAKTIQARTGERSKKK
jgi:hypothetical protein